MSTLPLTEAILLEIHQNLGCPGYRTTEKERFASAQDSFTAHKAMFEEILRGIFDALDMDPLACLDAIDNIQSMVDAYKSVELSTWTFDADERQILWTLLGYFFIPGLARHTAFWDLESPGFPEQFILARHDTCEGRQRLVIFSTSQGWPARYMDGMRFQGGLDV